MNDSKYDAGEGKRWVCVSHRAVSANKFSGWVPGDEPCTLVCMVNAQLLPLIRLEIETTTGKLLQIRENV